MVNKLRAYRFIRQKSQDRLFLETGIPQSKISKIENGYIKPTENDQRILARALGVRVDQLFD